MVKMQRTCYLKTSEFIQKVSMEQHLYLPEDEQKMVHRIMGFIIKVDSILTEVTNAKFHKMQQFHLVMSCFQCTTFMLLSTFLTWFCQILFGQYGVKFFHNILGILIFLSGCDRSLVINKLIIFLHLLILLLWKMSSSKTNHHLIIIKTIACYSYIYIERQITWTTYQKNNSMKYHRNMGIVFLQLIKFVEKYKKRAIIKF